MTSRVEQLSRHTAGPILLLIGLLGSLSAAAQQPIVPLQFSLSDPGARSLGFGGAFVALADDATAAFANPAGLVQLIQPEISIEARHWSHSTPYTLGGRVEGQPTGNGIDTSEGLRTATSDDDMTGLSFVSLAYPIGNWSFAFYRHEYANLEFSAETQGLFGPDAPGCCEPRYIDQRTSADLEIDSYGVSAAYRVNDHLDLGLGAVYHDGFLVADASTYLTDDDTLASLFALNSYRPERSVLLQRSVNDDGEWALTAGVLWRPSENWSIGGVYRQAPEFDMGATLWAGQAIDLGVPPGEILAQVSGFAVEFPEIYGLGLAYRAPDGRLTISFQWDHVEYSNIAESLQLDDQEIDDADELHLGGEYVFLGSTPIIAVRLGAWWDPDHQPRATVDDPLLRALLPQGDDEMHYSAGLGVAFESFQVDFGMEFADRVDTFSLSAIYSF